MPLPSQIQYPISALIYLQERNDGDDDDEEAAAEEDAEKQIGNWLSKWSRWRDAPIVPPGEFDAALLKRVSTQVHNVTGDNAPIGWPIAIRSLLLSSTQSNSREKRQINCLPGAGWPRPVFRKMLRKKIFLWVA